jgi:predicted RNA binding protein YcfA (HicA-like mRNA interferase family)
MPDLPLLKATELIKALQKAGFERIRQKGSHVRMRHPDGRVVTVPVHGNQEIGRGLLRKILRDIDWSNDDLSSHLH